MEDATNGAIYDGLSGANWGFYSYQHGITGDIWLTRSATPAWAGGFPAGSNVELVLRYTK